MRRVVPWILWAACLGGIASFAWSQARVPVLAPAIHLPAMPTTSWARVSRGDTAGLVTVPVQIGPHAEPFLVDTGAEESVLLVSALDALGLPREVGPRVNVQTTNEQVVAHRVALHALQVGTRRWSEEPLLLLDAVAPFDELGVAGILGESLFDGDLLLIEPRTVHLVHPDSPDRPDTSGMVRISLEQPGARVPVVIDGVELEAWIDTGATRTSLSWAAARRVGVSELGPGGVSMGADGIAYEVHEARFDHLSLGPHRFEGALLQVGHADDGVEVRLGMDLLAQLDRFGVDYATHELLVPEG